MRNSLFFVAALSLFLAALEAAQSENGLSSDGRRDETIDVSLEGRDGMDNSNIRVDDQRLHVENRREVQLENEGEEKKDAPVRESEDGDNDGGGGGGGGEATEELPPEAEEIRQIVENESSDYGQTSNQQSRQEGNEAEVSTEASTIEPGNVDRSMKIESISSSPGTVVTGDQEEGEISSLEEFKRKMLQEEEEKNKRVVDSAQLKPINGNGKKSKKKSNNYASVDCGAEVISVNPESTRCAAILDENKDDYMLNPCSANIWFVVKLCDIILVDTIEIANYEFFSSTPESFRVYVSDRNPTTEWKMLGTFQARAERAVQSFPLDEHVYARFIKVEMISHFGTEHYCPISLFRVLGSTMVEEYQDHEEQNEADQNVEDILVIETSPDSGSKSEGFISFISDFLYSSMLSAISYALPLQFWNQSDSKHRNASTSSNVTGNEASVEVNETGKADGIEVERQAVEDQTPSINQEVTDIENHNQAEIEEPIMTDDEPIPSDPVGVARKQENTGTQNAQPFSTSTDAEDNQNVEDVNHGYTKDGAELEAVSSTDSSRNNQGIDNGQNAASTNVKKGDPEMTTVNSLDSSFVMPENKVVSVDLDPNSKSVDPVGISNSNDSSTAAKVLINSTSDMALNMTGNSSLPSDNQNDTHTVETVASTFDNTSLDSPLAANGSATSSTQGQQANQKESVFIRLGNKIKTLESNLTLISHYLEELGLNLKKFKKNSTDLQKTFDRRLSQLNDTVMQQQEQLALQTDLLQGMYTHVILLTNLVKELAVELRDFRPQMYYTHGILIISELLLIVLFVITLLWFIQKKIHVIVQNLQVAVLSQHTAATQATNNSGTSSQADIDGHGCKSLNSSPIKAKDSGFVEVAATEGLGKVAELQPCLEDAYSVRNHSSKDSPPTERQTNLIWWSLQQLLSPSIKSLLDSVTEGHSESFGKTKEPSALRADKRASSLQTRML